LTSLFIPKKRMERAATAILSGYFDTHSKPLQLPIPVEEIALWLGYEIEVDNLLSRFGYQDTLGFICFETNQIWIDSALLHPKQEGRFNFTVSHEIGHHVLHGPDSDKYVQKSWPQNRWQSSFVCKDVVPGNKKDDAEVQADYFAANLLMPAELVRKHFFDVAGNYADLCSLKDEWSITYELKQRFGCSHQAMGHRLQDLKLWEEVNTIKELIEAF
jgi:hypothetical protein